MKQSETSLSLIPHERIVGKVLLIRGVKVMLDQDLAEMYGVTTGNLNKAVARNIARFPEDFTFQLSMKEFENLLFQFGRSTRGGRRTAPYVFTEQGVAMLSSVLRSKRAVQINIQIIRTFTRLRELLSSNAEMRTKIEKMDGEIQSIYRLLSQLLTDEEKPRRRIGFHTGS